MANDRAQLAPIVWDDIDKRKYYVYGPTMFLGVRAIIYPSTLVKTRLQVQGKKKLYNGTMDAFRKIIKYEGVRGLFKGFGANALNIITGNIYITVYELTRKYALESKKVDEFQANFVGGACASIVSQTVVVPLDVVSQHMMLRGQNESTRERARSAFQTGKKIVRQQGVKGLFRGYGLSVATYAPSSTIWWGSYGWVYPHYYNFLPEEMDRKWKIIMSQGIGGCTAGLLSAFLTNPLDVLRTRAQVYGESDVIHTIRVLIKDDGLMGFFNGVRARMIAMGTSGLLVVSTYELVKRLSLRSDVSHMIE